MKNKRITYISSILLVITVSSPIICAFQFDDKQEKLFLQEYFGNMLYVGGTGPGNFTKIQDAIDNASEGDIIFVFNGIYYEIVNVNKSLCIKGEKKEITTIDAGKKGYTVNLSANGVTISGFTIQNGSYSNNIVNEANLFVFSCNNTITGNIFKYSESGIMIQSKNGNIISENIVSNNDIGLWVSGSKNIVTKNLITNNSDMGINTFGSQNEIRGNVVTNNNGTGLYFLDSSKNNITDNEISHNSIGIILTWYRDNNQNSDNFILRNNFRNNTKRDAVFVEHRAFTGKNFWNDNFWGKPRILPKIIMGLKQTRFYYPTPFGALWFFIPWCNFDWHPARQPYNISI